MRLGLRVRRGGGRMHRGLTAQWDAYPPGGLWESVPEKLTEAQKYVHLGDLLVRRQVGKALNFKPKKLCAKPD